MDDSNDISPTLSQSIGKKTHCELVDILYKQLKNMLWAEAFAATLVLFILWWHGSGDRPLIMIWYGSMVLLSGLPRYVLANLYEHRDRLKNDINQWENAVTALLLMSGLGWAVAGTVLLPATGGLYQALILFLLIIVAAAANPFYSPLKKDYATFLLPTLFIPAIYLLSKNTNFYIFTGIAFLTFGMLMLITSIISSKLIVSALFFRFQNMELANDLLKANKSLKILATQDSLTNLPNRQFFNEQLLTTINLAKENNTQFALLFLDIDHFKTINDTLGHDAGDQLLITVGERFQRILNNIGLVFRLGGDEFVILVENTDSRKTIEPLAQKVCLAASEAIPFKDVKLNVSTSIGVSFFPHDGTDVETLLKHADSAMYYTKNNGGNNYTFYNANIIAN
ncbi:MAG: GGDEF domain-containing protein [Gammaproteobacteria bacterium]|nr:GGDEF domain-containing protein [Gammaproteobacteria bacterium]